MTLGNDMFPEPPKESGPSIEVGLPFIPFRTQNDIAMCSERTVFIGGGYGSGKSTSAAYAVFMLALANPWVEAYGETNPIIVVSAPTGRIMRDTTMPTLLRVIPSECIRKHRKSDNELLLANGCLIKFRSGKSKFEGLTICGIWLDECSLYTQEFFHNAVARVRDPNARLEKIIVSGIPFEGTWVEDQFREPMEGSRTFMLSAYQNPYLPMRAVEELKRRVSKDQADTLIRGRWMKRQDLIYPEFSISKHVKPVPMNASASVYLGIDPGMNHSVAIVCQLFDMRLKDGSMTKGLNVIDEVILKKSSLEELMRAVAEKGYDPAKGFIDPTVRRDEENNVRKVFPRMSLIKQSHKTIKNKERYGIDCVKAALEDAEGNVRIYISDRLKDTHAGLVQCLSSYRFDPRTEKPSWADNMGDHSADALRYAVVGLIPIISDFRPYTISRSL